ncbi:hypothetical protein B0J14DRAFT_706090 [Halenospora varia]|nr:hypothetical protein B0J14DRAFT_706090 [Halenospora varia]
MRPSTAPTQSPPPKPAARCAIGQWTPSIGCFSQLPGMLSVGQTPWAAGRRVGPFESRIVIRAPATQPLLHPPHSNRQPDRRTLNVLYHRSSRGPAIASRRPPDQSAGSRRSSNQLTAACETACLCMAGMGSNRDIARWAGELTGCSDSRHPLTTKVGALSKPARPSFTQTRIDWNCWMNKETDPDFSADQPELALQALARRNSTLLTNSDRPPIERTIRI